MPRTSKRFRFLLDFKSMFVFSTILGFSFGVLSIPLLLISNLVKIGPSNFAPEFIFIFIVGGPVAGVMNGVLVGVVGYPIYKWLGGRYPITYSGHAFLESDGE